MPRDRSRNPHVALAKIHRWITDEGKTTGSAAVLRDVLLSLAGHRDAKLFSLYLLDAERRAWLGAVIEGLEEVSEAELISAAGGL